MNDNENKTNAPIKLPVRAIPGEAFDSYVEDATGRTLDTLELAAALNEADALRSMLADADSIRIPTDNDGHFTTINKVAGQGKITKHLAGKWQVGPNYDEVYFDTALEAYAAIKPNAAAGETSDALEQGGDAP